MEEMLSMSNLTTSSAGRRILTLLDDNSFVEIGASVRSRSTDFNQSPKDAPGDGVITGYGSVGDRVVYVYAQDADTLGGSIGEMHARKIVNLYNLAKKTGYPVVGLLDSVGMRLAESTDALDAFGKIYAAMSDSSGVVPQIVAVFGNAGGGMAVLSELADFTFMEEKKAKLFIHSPNAVKGNFEEKLDTASSEYKAKEAGIVDAVASEAEIFEKLRSLLSFLPSNCESEADEVQTDDDLNRALGDIARLKGDTAAVISCIADDGLFFETKKDFAKGMVTGFIRLDGMSVGVIANRTEVLDEKGKSAQKFDNVLTVNGMYKACQFVNFCDAFNIPIVTFTNTKGFCNCINAEKGAATAAAKLVYAFSSASVAKINVIVGEAFGTAAVVMNSKSIGADYTYAWKGAKIGAMDGRHAAEILYQGENPSYIKEKAAEYDELQASSASAAARGYVDTIIEPSDTRKYVIGALEMLYGKEEAAPDRKHGTI